MPDGRTGRAAGGPGLRIPAHPRACHEAAMPAAPDGRPAAWPRSARWPSGPTAHAPTDPLPSLAYRKWLLRLSARSVTPAPGAAVRPSASMIASAPSGPTRYPVTDPPALPAYAKRPLVVTAIQHAAVSVVGADEVTTPSEPLPTV